MDVSNCAARAQQLSRYRLVRASHRILVALFICSTSTPALAQLAPTGGHYAGRSADTGFEPGAVNAFGGVAGSVPLILPTAHGRLPVPVQVSSGAHGVGAAGLGWDVPLSYVRSDTSFAARRPAFVANVAPSPRQQVTLTYNGRTLDLIQKGDTWVARHDAPEIFARLSNNAWQMSDGHGRSYTFTSPAALAGTGLWLLASISAPTGDVIRFNYAIASDDAGNSGSLAIDLTNVAYNFSAATGCAKNEINLTYQADAATPLSLSVLGRRVLRRSHTLLWLDVIGHASCGAAQRLRRYEMSYVPDADNQQPRLQSVHMYGRQGTAEETSSLPIAAFVYGAASVAGKLQYTKTQSIAIPQDADAAKVSSTTEDPSFSSPSPASFGSATWQSLTDMTGDGRPDLVYQKDGKLWIAQNRPTGTISTSLTAGPPVAPLADATFAGGPLEIRSSTSSRFANPSSGIIIDQVWRQAIDVNGDGRVDIVDAAEVAGQWVVYLNTPGSGPSGITWQRRSFSIDKLYHHMWERGLNVQSDHIPLSSRYTSHDRMVAACWRFDGTKWQPYPAGMGTQFCPSTPLPQNSTGPEETYVEWEFKDINGDGYPDVVFNSSPIQMVITPPSLSGQERVGQVRGGLTGSRVEPRDTGANNVDAVLNVAGVHFDSGDNPFSAPITIVARTACGISLWSEQGGTQFTVCDLADVNGDGIADRIEDSTVFIGLGDRFSTVQMTLPGPLAVQQSPQVAACASPAPGTTTFVAHQSTGMRDLNGDGIPDYIQQNDNSFQVYFGTGTGFTAAPTPIEGAFSFSAELERCDGSSSDTTSGLYDVDGDGKPEVVLLNGQNLDIYQLAGGSLPGTPEAGRLVSADNGYGAITSFEYRSAKQDGTTAHQVPFPEIVLSSIATNGSYGLGGSYAPTSYAYGDAQLMFDSALDTFVLPGYARAVELHVIAARRGKYQGMATLTDTYPVAAFLAVPKPQRFGRYLLAGRPKDVTVLSGAIGKDPWALLTVNLASDPRRVASTHYDWDSRLIEEPVTPADSTLDCIEMAYPLDYRASFLANLGPAAYNVCSAHGFMYSSATQSWRGSAAPPSANNVMTRTEVRAVDDFGRALTIAYLNDVFRTDDDVCVDTSYAAPSGLASPMLFATASRRTGGCKSPLTYQVDSWEYDGLAAGNVAAGLVTSHTVERHALDSGALIGTVREFDASFDATGNPRTVTSVREDGAKRTVSLQYDPFGLVPVHTRIEGSNVAPLESSITRDDSTLEAITYEDANHTQRSVTTDGFERELQTLVTLPGRAAGIVRATTYLGFASADPLGRRVVTRAFTDPVDPANLNSAPTRTTTQYMDELGRQTRAELDLGSSYPQSQLVVGEVSYDAFGRVTFEADPFTSAQVFASAYGTSYYFNTDGSPACFVRGKGRQPLVSASAPQSETFPTCYYHSYANHQETIGLSQPDALSAGSPQAGVVRNATLTAVGRLVSRATTRNGVRQEYATFRQDPLGNTIAIRRFLAPAAAFGVETSWSYDSIGQLLQFNAPESAAQFNRYSNWGELLETSWTDSSSGSAVTRQVINHFDAFSRLQRRDERRNGVTDPETVAEYKYDVESGTATTFSPTNLKGRLATATSASGSISLGYDGFGNLNARSLADGAGHSYTQTQDYHADGSLASLALRLPDTGYAPEQAQYAYDSAGRLASIRYSDAASQIELYHALEVDAFGRVQRAKYGNGLDYSALFAAAGRQLLHQVTIASSLGGRRITGLAYDAQAREISRQEFTQGGAAAVKTDVGYDSLGRLSASSASAAGTPVASWQFHYDALGNLHGLIDQSGGVGTTLSYHTLDRDRICRVSYGGAGPGGLACNVAYDGLGNTIRQLTPTGERRYGYFASGGIQSIESPAGQAHFSYDAFGNLQELEIASTDPALRRHDRYLGAAVQEHERLLNGSGQPVLFRNIPGPNGVMASRRGSGADWVFEFSDQRGNRFFADKDGAFEQDVSYDPFGHGRSSGVASSSVDYSNEQWNGGDALNAFGLTMLGARLYDPSIGRFLSRDALLADATAARSNPYAFAVNDPINAADPSGLDCSGGPCEGVPDSDSGGLDDWDSPALWTSTGSAPSGANSQASYRPPTPTTFSSPPKGPQTQAGIQLRASIVEDTGVELGDAFDFDLVASQNYSSERIMFIVANTVESEAHETTRDKIVDNVGSFSAGMGDMMNWPCILLCSGPKLRAGLGITSGDAKPFAHFVGSITGVVASVLTGRGVTPSVPKDSAALSSTSLTLNTLRDVNTVKCFQNCGPVALASAATLNGYPASAVAIGKTTIPMFEAAVGQSVSGYTSIEAITQTMRSAGPGANGMIFAETSNYTAAGTPAIGHVMNVVNESGSIIFADASGAAPAVADLRGYLFFRLLRTN